MERFSKSAFVNLIRKLTLRLLTHTSKIEKNRYGCLPTAARSGLKNYQIADVFVRRKHKCFSSIINRFVPMSSDTPSLFQDKMLKKIKSDPLIHLESFLFRKVDHCLAKNSESDHDSATWTNLNSTMMGAYPLYRCASKNSSRLYIQHH
jgi:hypothetical protein